MPDQAKRLKATWLLTARISRITTTAATEIAVAATAGTPDFPEIWLSRRSPTPPRLIANSSLAAATSVARQQPIAAIVVPSVTMSPTAGVTYSAPRVPNSEDEPANAATPLAVVPKPSISTAVPIV